MRKIIVHIEITKDEKEVLEEWGNKKGFSLEAMPGIALREGLFSYIHEKYNVETQERPGIISSIKKVFGRGQAGQ